MSGWNSSGVHVVQIGTHNSTCISDKHRVVFFFFAPFCRKFVLTHKQTIQNRDKWSCVLSLLYSLKGRIYDTFLFLWIFLRDHWESERASELWTYLVASLFWVTCFPVASSHFHSRVCFTEQLARRSWISRCWLAPPPLRWVSRSPPRRPGVFQGLCWEATSSTKSTADSTWRWFCFALALLSLSCPGQEISCRSCCCPLSVESLKELWTLVC